MKSRTFTSLVLFAVMLTQSTFVIAMETDQYNLPAVPLADIGDEVTDYTELTIRKAFENLNRKIEFHEDCLMGGTLSGKCKSRGKTIRILEYLRSEDAVAKAVYKQTGAGVMPFSKVGWWITHHDFEAQPARFKTSFGDSVHVTAPLNYLTISPTVRMYNSEFGTDKIEHIFQQGFDYYSRYSRALKKGASEEVAVKRAIKWGRISEKTFYGKWVSAIYSNADLAANFAGLRFYQGLVREVAIGKRLRPPVLKLKEGKWVFNELVDLRETLLRPFISDHLNEALNPNKIFNIAGYRSVIRRVVRKRACSQWFERDPGISKARLESLTTSLEHWHGEDYGFSQSKNFVTIANTCFKE